MIELAVTIALFAAQSPVLVEPISAFRGMNGEEVAALLDAHGMQLGSSSGNLSFCGETYNSTMMRRSSVGSYRLEDNRVVTTNDGFFSAIQFFVDDAGAMEAEFTTSNGSTFRIDFRPTERNC